MIIQIDTREKQKAIKNIIKEFDKREIKYISSKLYVGDYVDINNPTLIIDRKQNIAEIAKNATSDHDRVKRELKRLDDIGGKMIFLIEQNKIDGEPIKSLEDLILWEPKYGVISGQKVYRVLSAWKYKHNVDFVFCHKRSTGKKIIEILERKNNE